MSRSIGDYAAHEVGVTAEPEIAMYALKPAHIAIVIGSNGIFEFLSNEKIAQIIVPFHKNFACGLAANAVVTKAYQQWKLKQEKSIDDITCVVVFLDNQFI